MLFRDHSTGNLPSGFPHVASYKERDGSFPKPFLTCLTYLAEIPVKKLSLQFPITSMERDAVFTELSFTVLHSKWTPSPTSRFPSGPPFERDASFQSLPSHILQSPQLWSPPSRFPLQSSRGERRFISKAFLHLSLKVYSKTKPPSRLPNRAPLVRSAHFQSFLLHISWSPR